MTQPLSPPTSPSSSSVSSRGASSSASSSPWSEDEDYYFRKEDEWPQDIASLRIKLVFAGEGSERSSFSSLSSSDDDEVPRRRRLRKKKKDSPPKKVELVAADPIGEDYLSQHPYPPTTWSILACCSRPQAGERTSFGDDDLLYTYILENK